MKKEYMLTDNAKNGDVPTGMGKFDGVKKVFAERLKLLRQEKGIGQIGLAKELDVGKSVISLWERGECEPTLSKLAAIADYFGVTIDFLAGLEN